MVSDRALYAVAAVVIALGLSHSHTSTAWTERLTGHSQQLAEQVLDRAQRYATLTDMFLGRTQAGSGRTQAVVVQVQTQAETLRRETEKVRLITSPKVNRVLANCSSDDVEELSDDPEN